MTEPAPSPRATSPMSICVFCGASDGNSESYSEAAFDLGASIAGRGHQLVYGAAGIGTMGALARGAWSRGGPIVGVVPSFLRERERVHDVPPQEIVITRSLLQRKKVMIDRSDAFIALPGGYGTLDEVMEIASLVSLGVERRPLVLVDIDDAWKPFLEMLEEVAQRGFLPQEPMLTVTNDLDEAISMVEGAPRRPVPVAGPPPEPGPPRATAAAGAVTETEAVEDIEDATSIETVS